MRDPLTAVDSARTNAVSEVTRPAGRLRQRAQRLLATLPEGSQRVIRRWQAGLPAWLRRVTHGERTLLDRDRIGKLYLRGHGIEIGALHCPMRTPRAARVLYVDKLPVEDLRKEFPELATYPLVPVDILDDGERLGSIGDATQDFVIANHFIEHCQDPIGALLNMFRVLKPDGVLYLALPDKRYTFDADRPITPLAHVLADHRDGPRRSQRQHCEEWVRLVDRIENRDEAEAKIVDLMERNHPIHFHVWTQTEMLELLLALRKFTAFDVELVFKNGSEVIIVARRGGDAARSDDGAG